MTSKVSGRCLKRDLYGSDITEIKIEEVLKGDDIPIAAYIYVGKPFL